MTDSRHLEKLREAILDEFGADLEKVTLSEGDLLFSQGDPADAMYLVLTGSLEAVMTCRDGGELTVATIGAGEPVGELGILAGGKRSTSISAAEDTELVRLPKEAFEQLASASPRVVDHLAETIRRRLRHSRLAAVLPRIFGPLDTATLRDIESHVEWVSLRGGETLFRQDDEGDGLYILVSGRLRVVAQDPSGSPRVLNEVAPGELVGEMAFITGDARSASVHAIRDSKMAKLSHAASQQLSRTYPELMVAIARVLTRRLRKSEGTLPSTRPVTTVAVAPTSPDVPLADFARRLAAALSALGPTLHLDAARFDSLVGMPGAAHLAQDAPRSSRLAVWLDEQEDRHEFVVFEADRSASPWTRRCVRQADVVFLVARADADPAPGEIEAELLELTKGKPHAPWVLVLLHPDGSRPPSSVGRWLSARDVAGHYHVRMDSDADVERVVRSLTGRSIGLVLGGGGARGLAHIGVVRALLEARVPIDAVAGTSMGAVIAGATAMGMDCETLRSFAERVFIDARPHKEYTLPMVSMIRSRRLDRAVQMFYGDACIEDLWLPYFCVSCNLTTCEMVVHRSGPLWKAVRASISLPGVFVPVIDGGQVLVDGGVLNNLPGDLMRQLCGGRVIVVDVSPEKDLAVDREEFPSPWRMLRNRLLPW
ncbi:cyclic nucleotide-binding domain-containing protein, partial [bacterium]|nr:cyclic nucleotide-binding domain-containing protein [bacterium]